jgi:hypothetical protein
MNSKKVESEKKVPGGSALVSVLKGVGLRSSKAVQLLRKLLEAGAVQSVLESVAEVLLSESILNGKVPANAGQPSKDFALAVEAAISDVVSEYHMQGNPLTSRFVPPLGLVSEMCKQWIVGFAPRILETFHLPGIPDDPEVQDRLAVVALTARKMMTKKGKLSEGVISIKEDDLEDFCRKMSVALFLAFQHPNEANHRLIHGDEDDADELG